MKPLELPPGVVFNATPASANGTRWREANLIRWVNQRMQPVGGWSKLNLSAFASTVRALLPWTTNSGAQYTAILCESNLYVLNGDVLLEITPADGIVAPFADVTAGGYGWADYGAGTYGTPRPPDRGTKPLPPCYTLENWGDTLLAMTSTDGRLLQWDPNAVSGTLAAAVAGAPVSNRTFVVTPLRYVMVFGKGGASNKFGWCDQEDLTNWTLDSLTSLAGEYDIEPAAPLVAATNCADGVLAFTTKKAYIIRYAGDPFIYTYSEIGDAAPPINNATLLNTSVGPFWFSSSGFWEYNGSLIYPVPCDVWSWISENVNPDWVRFEAAACGIVEFSEYWWFFPSGSSQVNDKVVIFNFRTNLWSMGQLNRSAGCSSSYTTYPIMSDGVSLYQHEYGNAYGSNLPWIESYSLNAGSERESTITQLAVDIDGNADTVRLQLVGRQQRARGVDVEGPLLPIRPDGFVDARQTALDFRLRVKQTVDNGSWSLGPILIDQKLRGVR